MKIFIFGLDNKIYHDIFSYVNRIIFIYKITNVENNKVYIGQTVSIKDRWQQHKRCSFRPKLCIHYALAKYGLEKFTFEVIASCLDAKAADDAERAIILQENCIVPNGYNATEGGSNPAKSDDWRRKVSQALKGHKLTAETKHKISESLKGQVISLERRKKISDYNKSVGKKPAHFDRSIKFTDEQICLIKTSELSLRKLALQFDVDRSVIQRIKKKV